jgi:hypothetical protein
MCPLAVPPNNIRPECDKATVDKVVSTTGIFLKRINKKSSFDLPNLKDLCNFKNEVNLPDFWF